MNTDALEEKVAEHTRGIGVILRLMLPVVRGRHVTGTFWDGPRRSIEGEIVGATEFGFLVRSGIDSPVEVFVEDISEIA